MTENEIKEATLEDAIYCAKAMACIEVCEECRFYGLCHTWCDDVYRIIIDALEEKHQIKEVLADFTLDCGNTVENIKEIWCQLRRYLKIGTVEEFKALKEKNEPKKPQEISWGATKCPICGQEFGFNSHFNHCSNCGQKLDFGKEE